MNQTLRFPLRIAFILLLASRLGSASPLPHYVVTNDNVNGPNTATFYTIANNGNLTQKRSVKTGGTGIPFFFPGIQGVAVLHSADNDCVFVADSGSDDIAGIDAKTFKVTGRFKGSPNDQNRFLGIGLALNAKYLYATFQNLKVPGGLGTFRILPGCKLKFLADTPVFDLRGGSGAVSMAVHGNLLVLATGNGDIQSFNIATGVPVSNGDDQFSTGNSSLNNPASVEITKDGHYAIFGDISNETVVEVSDISSGKLAPTIAYQLDSATSSAGVLLSPDETLLYVSNNGSGEITAAFFNKTTGAISAGCNSGPLKGFHVQVSAVFGLALQSLSGTGGKVYVAETPQFEGGPSFIGVVNVQSGAGKCVLQEVQDSPVEDAHSNLLISIESYPPRSF